MQKTTTVLAVLTNISTQLYNCQLHNNAQCTGYSDQQAGIAAGVMIFTGLVIGSLTTARLFVRGS